MGKYLEAFTKLQKEHGQSYTLYGDRLLVEDIPVEEIKTKSGIVISKNLDGFGRNVDGISESRAIFVQVLSVGPGFVDSEGKDVPVELRPGDVILVSPNSVLWFSTFFNNIATADVKIGLAREQDVHMSFKGKDAFEQVRAYVKVELENEKK